MPQLVPFFFVNQVIFAFLLISVMIYFLSKYSLPEILRINNIRYFIFKI